LFDNSSFVRLPRFVKVSGTTPVSELLLRISSDSLKRDPRSPGIVD
jgi:hypothetical protein